MVEQSTLMQGIFQRADEMALTRDLPRLSGISDTRLNAIRSGEPLSSTEFELMCRALAVDSGAMYSGQATSPSRSPARFRAATAVETPNPMDVRLLALAAEQGRILGHLMALLRKEIRLQQHKRTIAVRKGELWREGYRLGEAAREALAPGKGPLSDFTRLLPDCSMMRVFMWQGSPSVPKTSMPPAYGNQPSRRSC